MPYADPEKRRQFQREYKAKWRKKQEKINQLRAFKVYVCPKFPFLWVARQQFVSGFLVTDDATVMAAVEAHQGFGKCIFPLLIDYSCGFMEGEGE
jgi:hypothetical protein